MVTPGEATVFIAVGSNVEPLVHVPAALELLRRQVRVTGCSTFYRTEPIGRAGQPPFLNGVWRIETALPPRALKQDVLRPIEHRLGRQRGEDRYGPRTIDLDIVLYGDLILNEPDLRLPAPDLERPFVVLPIVELEPQARLPGGGPPLESLVVPAAREGLRADEAITRMLKDVMAR